MRILFIIALWGSCMIASIADDERIFVDAKINGAPVRFSFDTGTGTSFVLYSTTARKFNMKVTQPPANVQSGPGQVRVGWTDLQKLDFGFTNFDANFLIAEIPPYLKEPEDGTLGWPAISNNIFSMDCITHRINFLTNLPESPMGWVQCHIRTNSALTLELPGDENIRQVIALDTGADDGVELGSQSWYEWETTHTNQSVTLKAYYTPSIGLVVKAVTWADNIAVGALALTDVPVREADSNDMALHSTPNTEYVATLGFAAMKRLDIIIDGKHGMAWLKPRETPPMPYWHNRLGAVFVPNGLQSNDPDLVAHVIRGGPAFAAGVRDGDALLKIGDLDCTQWRTDPNVLPLSRFLNSPAGTRLEFTLKRGGQIFKTVTVLQNILPPDAAKN
jgi:hypothetical protein